MEAVQKGASKMWLMCQLYPEGRGIGASASASTPARGRQRRGGSRRRGGGTPRDSRLSRVRSLRQAPARARPMYA
eukprot:6178003-Pleurochrysis_carterae.AAC.3